MADMKDALRKAGLVSEKEVRRSKHRDRVHRKQVGDEGLEAERTQRAAAYRAEQIRKKQADQQRAQALEQEKEDTGRANQLFTLLSESNLLGREAGPRRFYFEIPGDGSITFIDVTPGLAKRISQGDVAIVDTGDVLKSQFAAIAGKDAHRLKSLAPERLLFWNVPH